MQDDSAESEESLSSGYTVPLEGDAEQEQLQANSGDGDEADDVLRRLLVERRVSNVGESAVYYIAAVRYATTASTQKINNASRWATAASRT